MDQFPIHKKDEDSFEKNGSSKRSKESKGKMPDFIIIDDTHDYIHGTYRRPEPFQKKEFKSDSPYHYSLPIRFLCLAGMLISFMFAIGLLIWTTVTFVLAACLFFQHQNLNTIFRRSWHLYIHASVLALGLGIAAISPTIGIGLLVIYFSFQKESKDTNLFKTMLKRTFNLD